MRTVVGSQIIPINQANPNLVRYGEADEEWVTKKKVEITTTKNVERQIKRQLVLEDGRVVEDELPVITTDTTQDKQTFETDHDEDRKVEDGSELRQLHSNFSTRDGILVGDKFTSVKKIQDVRENVVQTEASKNLGDIRSKDIAKVLKENADIRKYLRSNGDKNQMVVPPRTLKNTKNHRVITDKEEIQERSWMNGGKMQNERIRNEEHIEYDSDETPDSGSESSNSVSSHHKLEPEVYKTRKDENFVEYFRSGKDSKGNRQLIKVGNGAHYVSESKELELEQDRNLEKLNKSPRLKYKPSQEKRSGKQENHTDTWLEKHFGSSSSSISSSSVDLSRSGGGLRRSASICDIRPVSSFSNVYYATVRKSGAADKESVKRREHKKNYEQSNRNSAYYTSSGHPVPPPRRKRNTDSESYSSYSIQQQKPEYIYGTSERNSSMNQRSEYILGKAQKNGANQNRSESIYGTSQRRSAKDQRPEYIYGTSQRNVVKPQRPESIYRTSQQSVAKDQRPEYIYGSSQRSLAKEQRSESIYGTTNRGSKEMIYRGRNNYSDEKKDFSSNEDYKRIYGKNEEVYSRPSEQIYSRPLKQQQNTDYTSQYSDHYASSKVSHYLPQVPIPSPLGSPSTKYRTRITLNGKTH